MNSETIYTTLLDQPRAIDGRTWHGLSYQLSRDESSKIEVREHGWPTKLTLWEQDGPQLDTLDEATVKQMIEAELPVDESYVIPPPPVPYVEKFTAEQWLDTQGLSLSRTPVFLYLRQSGAQSPKLDATEAYLNGILAQFAQDPSPRTAEQWGAAPWGFEETVAEAVGSLNQ